MSRIRGAQAQYSTRTDRFASMNEKGMTNVEGTSVPMSRWMYILSACIFLIGLPATIIGTIIWTVRGDAAPDMAARTVATLIALETITGALLIVAAGRIARRATMKP